jgi:hypothetical protein
MVPGVMRGCTIISICCHRNDVMRETRQLRDLSCSQKPDQPRSAPPPELKTAQLDKAWHIIRPTRSSNRPKPHEHGPNTSTPSLDKILSSPVAFPLTSNLSPTQRHISIIRHKDGTPQHRGIPVYESTTLSKARRSS